MTTDVAATMDAHPFLTINREFLALRLVVPSTRVTYGFSVGCSLRTEQPDGLVRFNPRFTLARYFGRVAYHCCSATLVPWQTQSGRPRSIEWFGITEKGAVYCRGLSKPKDHY